MMSHSSEARKLHCSLAGWVLYGSQRRVLGDSRGYVGNSGSGIELGQVTGPGCKVFGISECRS